MNVCYLPSFSTASCVSLNCVVPICLLYPCPYQYPYLIINPRKRKTNKQITISISSYQMTCTCTMGSSSFVSWIFFSLFQNLLKFSGYCCPMNLLLFYLVTVFILKHWTIIHLSTFKFLFFFYWISVQMHLLLLY